MSGLRIAYPNLGPKITNKIGTYVFWDYGNYLKEGGDDAAKWNNTFSQLLRQRARSALPPKVNVNELQQKLNYYYGKGGASGTEGFSEEQMNTIREILKEKMEKYTKQGVVIAYDRLAAYMNGVELSAVSFGLDKKGDLGKSGKANITSILKRLNQLVEFTKKANGAGANKIIEQINNLEQQWQKLITDASLQIKNVTNGRLDVSRGKAKDFIEDLNRLYRTTGGAGLVALAEGEMSEIQSGITDIMLNKGIEKSEDIMKELDRVVVGSTGRTYAGISVDVIPKGFQSGKRNLMGAQSYVNKKGETHTARGYTRKENGAFCDVNKTQEKIDVIFGLDDTRVGASVKSTYLNSVSSISLETGRNLLRLVQDQPIFVNHFLNVVPDRQEGPSNSQTAQPAELHRLAYINAMKLLAFGKALMGGRLHSEGYSESAGVFVINDKSAKQFRVFPMEKIVEQVIHNINFIEMDLDDYYQKWVPQSKDKTIGSAIADRIYNLLVQLRVQTIDIDISTAVFSRI